jgi:hypothetical protein
MLNFGGKTESIGSSEASVGRTFATHLKHILINCCVEGNDAF